ncbi:MAG: WhiB family transcriptional regulator [Acidimicrobiales bacterium]|jgi:WhiB family redox-sensing transcriptional regulator
MALTMTGFESWALDEWRSEASCRTADPDLFFPIGTTGPAVPQIEAAKIVCRTCPVQQPCLEFALTTNQDSGVWGAASEEERRALRKQRLQRRRAC